MDDDTGEMKPQFYGGVQAGGVKSDGCGVVEKRCLLILKMNYGVFTMFLFYDIFTQIQ